MPDEATLSDLPARVDYLQRKKALLLACTQPSQTLQLSLAAQPAALASKVCQPSAWSLVSDSWRTMLKMSEQPVARCNTLRSFDLSAQAHRLRGCNDALIRREPDIRTCS